MGRLTQITCRAGLALARHFAVLLLVASPVWADRLSEADIFTRTDAALEQLWQGDADAAFDALLPVYDASYRETGYSPRAAHYPLLGLAYIARAKGRWGDARRYASFVAGGLEFAGLRGSGDWLRAQVLHGAAQYQLGALARANDLLRGLFPGLAETNLPQEHQLALYLLARIASEERLADERQLRDAFLKAWRPGGFVTQPDALHIAFFDIVARFRAGEDRAALATEMANLRDLAAKVPGIAAGQLLHYRGYHGFLLAHAGDFNTAEGHLQAYFDHLMAERAYGRDLWENALFLGSVLGQTQGAAAQIRFFDTALPLARSNGASVGYRAQYLREMGHAAAQMGDVDGAQARYRAAYAEARQAYRSNAGLVTHLREFINTAHPAMAGFDFAAELGAVEAAQFALRPLGEQVLRLFLQGNYTVTEALLARAGQDAEGDSPELAVTTALHHALLGQFDPAQDWLARVRATGTADVDVSHVVDLTDALSRVWSTWHSAEAAGPALDRLMANVDQMPPELQRMTHVLRAQRAYQLERNADKAAALEAFDAVEGGVIEYPLWDLLAAVTAMEMSFGFRSEEENTARHAKLKERIAAAGNLPVLGDYLDVVYFQNSRSGLFAADAVAHLGAINTRLSEDTPTGHSLRQVAALTLSQALFWRGENRQALDWAERAAGEIRADPFAKPEVLALTLSRQSDILRAMSRREEAASIAAEAYDILRRDGVVSAIDGAVLQSYANAHWAFTGDAGQVAALLQRELASADLAQGLAPRDVVALYSLLAQAQIGRAAKTEVMQTLGRALAAMGDTHTDWRQDRARILWTRAQVHARRGDRAPAFADMVASNDTYQDWRQDRLAAEDAEAIDDTAWRDRVRWEAALGWRLQEELPQ
ncbi:hypothetical protein PGB28_02940 [Primorskyibacter aestuariivivens]|uniref:hypothetical protein n=1 Tax=Primorskyibacter aestuariivivens TaxID=1888912 RepID=UPI0023005EF9|nr:hypothetical protein [Primorskyibacter aestuariivivens]MDA7427401.1 hypothetical protein [Primorskyibacter aestuariivivens]